ncbi:MAG: tRNA (guanosine(46)-N7)-methyltransferase TrmB [Beijerinckiaceae bacterium]
MTADNQHPPFDDGRAFFGRRKSHTLRKGREAALSEAMPALRIADEADLAAPAALFGKPVTAVWMEIGFGGGEHLLQRAAENPDVGFIGCEAYIDGVARVVGEIVKQGHDNIRLYDGDAIHLIERLPDGSLDRIYLLYPDPWPKRRQRKRRFVSDERLAELARILKPGGEFRFATDIDDYAAWVLARVQRSPDFIWTAERAADWLTPWNNWKSTRYEAKALREGRVPTYLTFVRK